MADKYKVTFSLRSCDALVSIEFNDEGFEGNTQVIDRIGEAIVAAIPGAEFLYTEEVD